MLQERERRHLCRWGKHDDAARVQKARRCAESAEWKVVKFAQDAFLSYLVEYVTSGEQVHNTYVNAILQCNSQ